MEDKKIQVLACAFCRGCCWNCFYADACGDYCDTDAGRPIVTVSAERAASLDKGWFVQKA